MTVVGSAPRRIFGTAFELGIQVRNLVHQATHIIHNNIIVYIYLIDFIQTKIDQQ